MNYAYLSGHELGIEEHIVVLPCGGKRVWNARRLKPALEFTLPDGSSFDRMFRSFIFMCVAIGKRSMHPLANPFGEIANQSTWQSWMDELYTSDRNLDALHHAASQPVDVWISLPYPRRGQLNFGEIHGRTLNFADDEDRLEALYWWMDAFLQRWEESKHLHDKLVFRGFVWLREMILPEEDGQLVARVNQGIHARNQLAFWLPNYGSYSVWEWRNFGFDVAALNPDYYGSGPYGREWIEWTGMAARTYNMGIQIPCGRGLFYDDTHLIDYFNLGLPKYSGYMIDSVVVYRFTNYSIRTMYRKDFESYRRLYTFVRGIYRETHYPDRDY
ncbi:hypothetical protein GCM10025857_31180 [Alicyclobacillus contaminans]|uniref:DUF4855 domain-containing protein n=1 Tax=Alicyclobacillus contaminans TaxID=392016 RepID=UPI000478FF1C|nr:DUF4855 domain-containing protein [Alicyclobacillus contaminans]GMA51761.1 hypothetical protein GCM10025857_31180 [Alicyclobacillus contaminans]